MDCWWEGGDGTRCVEQDPREEYEKLRREIASKEAER